MSTNELSIGVLGVGNIGTVHLQSALAMEGVTVTAAADMSPELRGRARSFGVEAVYPDYKDLLERESVDAVVVALPPSLHAEAVEAAADRGAHAFVEKPFATSTEAADRMLAAADDAGVSLGVDHTLRYHPEIRTLKRRYDEGALGRVPLCQISRINDGPFNPPPAAEQVPEWQLDPSGSGHGALLDLGVHLFDVLEWFFGPVEVRHAAVDRQLELPYEDTATVQLEAVETGTFASMHCGFFQWETPPDVNLNLRLEGITGSLESREFVPDRLPVHAARSAVRNVAKRLRGEPPDVFKPTYYYAAHFEALRDFCHAVRDGESPPVSGRDGRRAVELVETTLGAAETARTGEPSSPFEGPPVPGGQ